jgi:hypothetical protein
VKAKEPLTIKPGPNNPVGLVWIDLTAPSYGIHGTPEPGKIGKSESHGCRVSRIVVIVGIIGDAPDLEGARRRRCSCAATGPPS